MNLQVSTPKNASLMLYARVLFFCEVNKNKNAKEYLCLGLLIIEHACNRSCLVKSLESSDVALWKAGCQVKWQVGSGGQNRGKGG